MIRSRFGNLLCAALLCLAACGAPSSLDLCHQTCDANQRCGVFTDEKAANCNSDCDANKGALPDADAKDDQDCKNGGDVRRKLLDCLSQECDKINTCLDGVVRTCIQR
jgi:hypothetical protein